MHRPHQTDSIRLSTLRPSAAFAAFASALAVLCASGGAAAAATHHTITDAAGRPILNLEIRPGAESGTGADVTPAQLEAVEGAAQWLPEILGPARLTPTIQVDALSYANAYFMSWFLEDGEHAFGRAWREGAGDPDGKGGLALGTIIGGAQGRGPASVLVPHGRAVRQESAVLHELTHALGMSDVSGEDGLFGFRLDSGAWVTDAFSRHLSWKGEAVRAGMTIEELLPLDKMPDDLKGNAIAQARWLAGYSCVGFSGSHVTEVVGKDTVLYFPDEATDDEALSPQKGASVTGAIPILGITHMILTPGHPEEDCTISADFSHVELQNSFLSHQQWRNWGFFMEAELAMLQDLGYDFDRKRFFGTSIYRSAVNETVTEGFWARSSDEAWLEGEASQQANAVGVHVYGSRNTVTIAAHQRADGPGAVGVRVDGSQNALTINPGVLVSADGAGGTGLAVTYGRGHVVSVNGTVEAVGAGGTALLFDYGGNTAGEDGEVRGSWIYAGPAEGFLPPPDLYTHYPEVLKGSLVKEAVVTGVVRGGSAAVRIGPTAHVKMLRFADGAQIEGDVVSTWSAVGEPYRQGTAADGTVHHYAAAGVTGFEGVCALAPVGTDLTTELVFGSESAAGASGADAGLKTFTYAGNVAGPWSIRMRVAAGTELVLEDTRNALVGMTVSEGAALSGPAHFDFSALARRRAETGWELLAGDASGTPDFVEGALVNAGTLISSPATGRITVRGDYVQTGRLVLGVKASGELIPLDVSGTSSVAPTASLGLVPGGGWFEGTYEDFAATGLLTTSAAAGDSTKIIQNARWDVGRTTAAGFSPTVAFTVAHGALTAKHKENAYSAFLAASAPAWQQALARGLDRTAAAAPTVMHDLYGDLDYSAADGSGIARAIGNLGAASKDEALRAAFAWERLLNRRARGELARPVPKDAADLFAAPVAARFDAAHSDATAAGALFGVRFRAGALDASLYGAAAHLNVDAAPAARKSGDSGETKGTGLWLGGALARTFDSGLRVEGMLRAGWFEGDEERSVMLAQNASRITADVRRASLAAALRAGPEFTLERTGATVMPYAALSGAVIRTQGESESGAGALAYGAQTLTSAAGGFGVAAAQPVASRFADYRWTWRANLEWTHEFTKTPGGFTFGLAGAAGDHAERSTAWAGRNRLAGGLELELLHASGFSTTMSLDAESADGRLAAAAGSMSFRWRW